MRILPVLKQALGRIALLPLLALVLLHRSTSPSLLRDSDTAFLVMKIRERAAPFSWFGGDWPLFNHFYRPVSTLTFEIDNALHGDNAAGYGLTNALLVVAGIAALYALLRRFFPVALAWTGAALFAFWTVGFLPPFELAAYALMALALILAARSGRWAAGVLVALGIWALLPELWGIERLYATTVAWLPGRTATTCGLFALLALASYAGSVALGAEPREPRAVLPTDPPATRNTVLSESRPGLARGLFGLSLLCTALSLGSYEQGVMVPALIFGVGMLLSPAYRVRFGAQSLHWGLLVGYLVLRAQLVPVVPSGYQRQVVRFGPGVLQSLVDYASPRLGAVQRSYTTATIGFEGLLLGEFWLGVVALAAFLALWTIVDSKARRTMAIWAVMSLLAFLPMAFLKHFEHYHYLPMALRTGFVLSAAAGLVGAFRRAASPREVLAPPRSRPAPGSLPHL